MEVHLGVKPATYKDGTKLSDVAAWNNYGTETIPPRPVWRIAAENILGSEEFKKILKLYLDNIVVNPIKSDVEHLEIELLRKIGQQSAAEAKRIILAGSELQTNAPATIAHKGFNKPLYETGLMVKNIGYEISE